MELCQAEGFQGPGQRGTLWVAPSWATAHHPGLFLWFWMYSVVLGAQACCALKAPPQQSCLQERDSGRSWTAYKRRFPIPEGLHDECAGQTCVAAVRCHLGYQPPLSECLLYILAPLLPVQLPPNAHPGRQPTMAQALHPCHP